MESNKLLTIGKFIELTKDLDQELEVNIAVDGIPILMPVWSIYTTKNNDDVVRLTLVLAPQQLYQLQQEAQKLADAVGATEDNTVQ